MEQLPGTSNFRISGRGRVSRPKSWPHPRTTRASRAPAAAPSVPRRGPQGDPRTSLPTPRQMVGLRLGRLVPRWPFGSCPPLGRRNSARPSGVRATHTVRSPSLERSAWRDNAVKKCRSGANRSTCHSAARATTAGWPYVGFRKPAPPSGVLHAAELDALYRELGGLLTTPVWRPGAWDLVFAVPSSSNLTKSPSSIAIGHSR
jgi:hypothetical protein